MNRKNAATIVTLLLLAGIFAAAVLRRDRAKAVAPDATPRDTIYQMLDAARAGDPAAYLSHYTGGMETQLKQSIAEKSESGFKQYLLASNAEIKGVALAEPKLVSDSEAEVSVEYVYQDRNEVQRMYLEKRGDRWKIARVDGAERVKTLVPYGTPVE
jgi:hypothetical protein